MNKKLVLLVLLTLLSLFLVTACTNNNREPAGSELMMATTTSTADTGILEFLTEQFLEDTGIHLRYTSVGTGEALSLGRNGDVDIVFVHARASEEQFVADGYGMARIPVMFNDFVVVGPEGYISYNSDVFETFRRIHELQLPFVSRGDNSGTHQMEMNIWAQIGLEPMGNPNYVEAGQGMGATLSMTDEMEAFTLSDRGTWLRQSQVGDIAFEIMIICEGDEALFNQYGIIAVNPEIYPEVNYAAANAFIEWIVTDEIQELIRNFGVEEFGEPLFVPNAGTDS